MRKEDEAVGEAGGWAGRGISRPERPRRLTNSGPIGKALDDRLAVDKDEGGDGEALEGRGGPCRR